MKKDFTLEFWIDDDWYVGRLKEVPGIFSQGETLEELEANIIDAYQIMMEEVVPIRGLKTQTKEIGVNV